jgi:hypothetical protein
VKLKKTANLTFNFLTPVVWGRRQISFRPSKKDVQKCLETLKAPMWQYAASDGNYVERDQMKT